jgi:hypothetical protein
MLAPDTMGGAYIGTSEGDLGGGIKIETYLGELLEKLFLINSLNFDLRTLLRELLEMLLEQAL